MATTRHRWSDIDFTKVQIFQTCSRCGAVLVEDGFLAKGSRIVRRERPECRTLPSGMKRVA